MNIGVVHKTIDVAITFDGDKATGKCFPVGKAPAGKLEVLRLHFSLLGETKPMLSPLAAGYTFGKEAPAYRFDWIVGITPRIVPQPEATQQPGPHWWRKWPRPAREKGAKPRAYWNWLAAIRKQRAFAVQLLIDEGESGCTVSEFATHLLGLQPSKDSTSWLEKNADAVGKSLHEVGQMTAPLSHTAANILNASALMSNFVRAGEHEAKRWFIYRCLDEKKKCAMVEWNIHRSVLEQYGPLLRGSIVLAFHGTENREEPITLLLRPRLGFGRTSEIDYLPSEEDLESETPVALRVTPCSPFGSVVQGKREVAVARTK